jgi:hypothetical protein
MEQGDVEAMALEARRKSGAGDEQVISLTTVIEAHMGQGSVELVDTMVGHGALVRVGERSRIMLRRGYRDLRFVAAHEFAHWVFASLGLKMEHVEEERAANTFAAALLAPAALVRKAYGFFGEKTETIAERLKLSQTSAVLRLAEVRGDARAVVTRSGHVFVRGASPTLTRERAAEAARGQTPRGLAKARMRGGIDEGRVAVRAV